MVWLKQLIKMLGGDFGINCSEDGRNRKWSHLSCNIYTQFFDVKNGFSIPKKIRFCLRFISSNE